MRSNLVIPVLLAALVPVCTASGFGQSIASSASVGNTALTQNYAKLPLTFEANRGQTDARARFVSHGKGYSLFLTDSAAVLELSKAGEPGKNPSDSPIHAHKTDVVRMELAGASHNLKVEGTDQLPGKVNYFIGSNSANWHSGIPTYAKVEYSGVYPGVDLVYYGNERQLEYDFVVAPGANAKPIHLHFAGASKLKLGSDGDLSVIARNGEIVFHKPVVYQMKGGQRQPVEGQFSLLAKNAVGFRLGRYDHTQQLVIDPVLAYSTYLGGTNGGNYGGDYASAIAVDSSDNAYVTGQAESTNFPVTQGAYQTANTGANVVFVAKFNPSGSALIYSTYIGGDVGQYATGIAVDGSGNAYVTGRTEFWWGGYPVTPGAFQNIVNGDAVGDIFVTKLNASGTALIYSTTFGGTDVDTSSAIAVDSSGDAYLTGNAPSANFPVTSGAFQTVNNDPNPNGPGNAFVTELNPAGTGLVYSTFLGGSGGDYGTGIAVNTSGDAYLTGYTYSGNFPVSEGAFQFVNNAPAGYGGRNAFVTAFNKAGSALIYSTYLGGTYTDSAYNIAIDSAGDAYVVGTAGSTDFPVTTGAFMTTKPPVFATFVSKFNPTGTALLYSTFLGTCQTGAYSPANGIAVDGLGDAYVIATTSSSSFPVTTGAYQTANPGSDSAFVTKLNSTGTGLLYSTYFGGSYSDTGYAIALDSSGDAYIAGATFSNDFPVTSGAYQTDNRGYANGDNNAFISKLTIGGETTTTVTSNINPELEGEPVTFSATVVPIYDLGIPTGSVTFNVDGVTEATASLNSAGVATYTTSALGAPTATTASIVASYSGDTNYVASVSPAFTENITREPLVSLSATSLAFGIQPAGTTSGSQSVTLTNVGGATLKIISIAVTGTNASQFGFSNTCGTSVAAGASCTIHGHFAPTAGGAMTAAVTITDNTSGSPQTISLSGTGGTTIGLTSDLAAFGYEEVGATTASKIITLTNTGAIPLTVSSIAVTGVDASSFIFGNSCGTSVAVGGTCTIHGHFTPTVAGDLTAAVTITDNASGSPQAISLTGTGVPPDSTTIMLSSTMVYFDIYEIGTISPSQDVTLTNTGGTTLSITGFTLTGVDAASFDFASSCGTTVAPGASCQIHGHFAPTLAGALTATATMTDSAVGSPHNITLSGTGAAPNSTTVSFTPSSLTLASQAVGTTSATQTITVTNTGTAPLAITGVTVTGADASSFAFSSSCGTGIAAGATCTLHGHFAPKTTGTLTAAISVTDSATMSPQSIPLTGTGH